MQTTIDTAQGTFTVHVTDHEAFTSRLLLPPDLKERWLVALRSGQYEQGRGWLCANRYKRPDSPWQYCCLGVLCDIERVPSTVKPGTTFKTFKFPLSEQTGCLSANWLPELVTMGDFVYFDLSHVAHPDRIISLADLNDKGFRFAVIADIIERLF